MRLLMGIFRGIMSCFALVGGVLFFGLLVFSLSMVVMRTPHGLDRKTDAIVVLTGGQGRVDEGLKAYHEGLADRLLISGVHKDVRLSEVLRMWKGKPLNAGGISLDPRATTTVENAVYSIDWAKENDVRSIRLITAYYHMPRAYWEFKRRMPGLKIIPHSIAPETGPPYWKMLLAEYGKVILSLLPTSPEA